MGAVKNSGVFKGVSVNGQIAKGLAKNGVVFWKQETLHAHTVKILARATAIGATPPTNIANFDSYVRCMYPIWMDYCDVFFRFRGTGDANFKRINLANPDGALADFYGGYTLDISGIKGNGVNAYVDTNFNPSLLVSGQKYQLEDAEFGGVVSEYPLSENSNASYSPLLGTILALGRNTLYLRPVNASKINGAGNNLNTSVDMSGAGFKAISRISVSNIVLTNKNIENVRTQNVDIIDNSNQFALRGVVGFSNAKASSVFMGKALNSSIRQQIRTAENADMANLGLPQIA